MSDWLPVKAFADAAGVSERAVRLRIQRGGLKAYREIQSRRGGSRGTVYEIHRSELALSANDAVIVCTHTPAQADACSTPAPVPAVVAVPVPVQETASEPTGLILTDSARKTALAKYDLLQAWKLWRETHDQKTGNADSEFVCAYNSGLTHEYLFAVLGETSLKTLYRWNALYNETKDWRSLAPQYQLQRQNPARLTPLESKVFLGFLLNPRQIPIGTATKFTRLLLDQRGCPSAKSDMTFRRFAEDFAARHYDTWILMREGQKALKDKVEPYIKRDPGLLEVGDVLVADGHRLNFQVINPYTGKPCRATLVGYVDWKSFDLVGYEIMVNENTQCIASAMRNACIRLGKFPRVSYQDNGKAFKAKFFLGSPSLEECGFHGLFGRLGIVPVFATPYNARAKIIERFFKEFCNTFERLFPSFVGSSIATKPAYMMRNEKFHKAIHNEYVPTIEEAIALLESWLEFHRSQPCPHVPGKTIGEVFMEGCGPGVDVAQLDDLMMEDQITNIRRNGIRFLGADYYDDNLYGLREQVVIRYSLFDLTHVNVYARSGEFIGTAKRVQAVHPMARVLGTERDIDQVRQGIAKQKRAEKKTMQGVRELSRLGKGIAVDWSKPIENAPRLVDKMEREGIELAPTHEQIPDAAVLDTAPSPGMAEVIRLEPETRPLFDSSIERYEWHLRHGVFTAEDEAWCVWFRTTDDFAMLFLAEHKAAQK